MNKGKKTKNTRHRKMAHAQPSMRYTRVGIFLDRRELLSLPRKEQDAFLDSAVLEAFKRGKALLIS